MKIALGRKGGIEGGTVAPLLSNEALKTGYPVLVDDLDESNLGRFWGLRFGGSPALSLRGKAFL